MPSKLFMISLIIFTGFSAAIIFCLFVMKPKVPLLYTARLCSFPIQNSSIQRNERWILELDSVVLDIHTDILFLSKKRGKVIYLPLHLNDFQGIYHKGNKARYLVILNRKDVNFISEDSVLSGEILIMKNSTNNLFNNLLSK